jgi:hypothetical protein
MSRGNYKVEARVPLEISVSPNGRRQVHPNGQTKKPRGRITDLEGFSLRYGTVAVMATGMPSPARLTPTSSGLT